MRGIGLFAALLAMMPGPASAREALGVFGSWGAFRDERPLRCFAIAEPARRFRNAEWRPFASVATWPGSKVRAQIHIRLRHARSPDEPVTLAIGERRFALVGGGADAWAPDARTDAAIVAAMRSGSSLSIGTRSTTGRAFADVYRLRGAATAIDAAALACARLR
jgi:hypothetical protein